PPHTGWFERELWRPKKMRGHTWVESYEPRWHRPPGPVGRGRPCLRLAIGHPRKSLLARQWLPDPEQRRTITQPSKALSYVAAASLRSSVANRYNNGVLALLLSRDYP